MNYISGNSNSTRILWTGGWDSTFQLLRLLLLEKRPVEPYYLLNEDRPSTDTEISTMEGIRTRIQETDRSVAELMSPTRYFSVSEIPKNPEITHAYQSIRNIQFIGRQYDWLPRFCDSQGITGLQLCIHKDDKAAGIVAPIVSKGQHANYPIKVGDQNSGTNEHLLFKYFEFPILDLTKTDMAIIARKHGWSHIMDLTWFCHKPKNGKPCGQCNPCKYTIEEGLAWRVPISRRVIGKLPRPLIRRAKKIRKTIFRLFRKSYNVVCFKSSRK